jgi:hypothetical protein
MRSNKISSILLLVTIVGLANASAISPIVNGVGDVVVEVEAAVTVDVDAVARCASVNSALDINSETTKRRALSRCSTPLCNDVDDTLLECLRSRNVILGILAIRCDFNNLNQSA